MSDYLELVKLIVSWPVVILIIFFTLIIKSRHLHKNSLVTKIVDRISKFGIKDVMVELREKVSDQQIQIGEQQEMLDEQSEILRRIVAFSMSFHIYAHLREIYYRSSNPSEEYLYQTHHERDLYFLRDHGYIESKAPSFLKIRDLKPGDNLLSSVKLTPAGVFYVELREKLKAEKYLAPTAQRRAAQSTVKSIGSNGT